MKKRFSAESNDSALDSVQGQDIVSRRLRIVIDARNRRSSTGRYSDRLLENLQNIDQENEYIILVDPKDSWKPRAKNFDTKKCRYKQFSFNPLDQIGFAFQLYRLQPNLVHFTMTQQPVLYFGKIITTTHDLTMLRHTRPSRFPGWLHRIGMSFYKFLFWWSHLKSNKIIVPSQYVADDLAKHQPSVAKKIEVIYEAADPPLKVKPESVKGVKKPFIFHVGAPYPHKNIHRLIEAFDVIKEKHPGLQLVLPGRMKDQFKKDFDSWVKKSEEKKSIIAPGFVSDAELKWLYENAEAYVLPSLSEGFGLPGLEAMAHDCPLISSDATCLPEIYGEAAQYFHPRDIFDLASAVDKVISNKKRQSQLVKKGQKQLAKYSWRQMGKQTLAEYKEQTN